MKRNESTKAVKGWKIEAKMEWQKTIRGAAIKKEEKRRMPKRIEGVKLNSDVQ